MKKMMSVLAGAMLVWLLASCGAVSRFNYPADMDDLALVSPTPFQPYKVAVPPFKDSRLDLNLSSSLWIYLLPLCPYGYVEYYRPEKAERFVSISEFIFNPTVDLAQAAVFSLRRSNLFTDVNFTPAGKNAELVFNGEIIMTYYKGRLFTYGLSWTGPLLWLIGAPAATSGDRLRVKFSLTRPGRPQPMWEYVYDGDDWTVQWIYGQQARDTVFFSSLMQEAMNSAIRDLRNRLERNPDLLK